MPSLHQQRLISMLEYLEHWDKLNRSPVYDVSAHQGLVIWQNDLSELPGFHLNTADSTGEVWLAVERLRPQKPPALPSLLTNWVFVSDDPAHKPHRRESNPDPQEPKAIINFDDDSARESAFLAYLEGVWAKWADTESPRRKSIGIYDKLFNLLQTIETEGAETALELVWGVGIALWKPEKLPSVRYPLISHLVEIDPVGMDMALRIRPRDLPPLLETDVYAAMDNPKLPVFEKAARTILEQPDHHVTPFDEASFEQILSGAAGTLDRHARYWPREVGFEPGKLPQVSEALTITNTWVVFARRKGSNFLLDDVRRLKAKVEEAEVPAGAATVLVEDAEGEAPQRKQRQWRGLSSTGFTTGWSGSAAVAHSAVSIGELYFPKPFNAEQIQIIDRLENSSGVVVQGPPGTGKTHTIANVISHYLAEGKRVLVTSKGESALAVLRDQLPPPIRDLTVSLLTSERDGLKQLEQSVAKICTEITTLNPAELSKEISRNQTRIDQIHQKINDIDRQLAAWAKKNIDPAPGSLGGMKPAEMARIVVEQAASYEWFPDALDSRPEHEPKFSTEDVAALGQARIHVGENLIYLTTLLPPAGTVPSAIEIGELHRQLIEFHTLSDTLDEQSTERLKATRDDLSDTQRLGKILDNAERVAKLLREAAEIRRSLTDKWVDWLRAGFEARHAAKPAFKVVLQKKEEIESLLATRRQFIGVAIEWLDEWDTDDDLLTAVQNAAAGKSPFGMLSMGKKQAKQRLQQILLNGQVPKVADDWKWIESHIAVRRQTGVCVLGWNALAADCPSPLLPRPAAEALRASEEIIEQIAMAEKWVSEIAPNLTKDVEAVFSDLRADGVVDDPDRMEKLASAIDLRVRRKRLETSTLQASQLAENFRKSSLPIFAMAAAFVAERLGKAEVDSHTVKREWTEISDSFERMRLLQPAFETIHQVCTAIEHNGAPIWANQLRIVAVSESGDGVLRQDWASAWKWKRQFGHLLEIDGRTKMHELAKQRIVLQNDLSNAYTDIVERLTWLRLKETLDKDRGLMASLQQYMAAIRGIGAGTGVRAVRFRRDARKAMLRANQAIRCWIMPHWRVSESLPSELALFDLVIVDEASQSDLWALPAMLRAKKLLVVGDNKQVSPSAVGVKEADISQLHTRFLRTLPFGDVLSPDKSVYDLASVMFASDLVRLREHFRCVEPIIEFSNRLCYNGEIKCLRVPTAAERITPPLVDVFVKDGAREGRAKINRAEAQAIINEIKLLAGDARYAKRSMGVVSLLGGDQAKLIFEMLISQLGEETILKHKIRCGDAMTFQGREADIIFISMVADAEGVRALSGEMYEQRFNVAVSRARDRLYLFRSFKREELRENDLRAQLVNHFQNPLRRDTEKKGRERCESDFERAMFDRLNTAGYRVLPQVSAGGFRIDMVVEGTAGRRLAIECDGDQYHGPEVWMEDLQRQRTLERAGWTFWRCWGSSFLRDPDLCMNSLFTELKDQGIDPIGGLDADLTDVVEYREVWGHEPEPTEEAAELDTEAEDDGESAEPASSETDTEAAPESDAQAPRRVDDVDDPEIQQVVQIVLQACPNQSCTLDSLPTKVLKYLGIRTRSGPRAEFEKRVKRNLSKLERRGVIERYKATNERVRLIAAELL